MKILNLYAGIGGNRKLWGDDHEITAVEDDAEIASVYSSFFPKDKMIIADAHEYLREHFQEYDFIWSSPPCQSHSSFRQNICVRRGQSKPIFPDMKLYEEILFLKYNYKGKWVVENVRPYYKPLIRPDKIIARHCYWMNFEVADIEAGYDNIHYAQIKELQERHGFDLSEFKLKNKRQVLRNCVSPTVGEYFLNTIQNENPNSHKTRQDRNGGNQPKHLNLS